MRTAATLVVCLYLLGPSTVAQAFEAPSFVNTFGHTAPDTPADFDLNRGIGLDQSTGEFFVSDDKLRRFDPNGVLITEFSCQGCYGVDVNTVTHELYAAVRFADKIARYSLTGTLLGEFGSSGSLDGQFFNPVDVTIDSTTGEVYVIDGLRVQVFDAAGNFLRKFGTFGTAGANSIFKIAWDPATRSVWVADAQADLIAGFTEFGVPLASFGDGPNRNQSTPGALRWPRGLDIDENSNIHVADGDNERMAVFDPNGTFLAHYQGPHVATPNIGPFHPRAVAINRSNGRRYVAAGHAPRVDVFDPNNQLLFSVGDREHNGTSLWNPKGVAVSQVTGDVYVLDTNNYLIKRFSSSGTFLSQHGGSTRVNAPQLGQPFDHSLFGMDDIAIATDGQGHPWTSMNDIHYKPDEFMNSLRRFDPNVEFEFGVGPYIDGVLVAVTSAYSGFDYGLAIDPATDLVYASDAHSGRNRIRIHAANGVEIDRILGVPRPAGLAIHGDRLYVALAFAHKIREYRISDHTLMNEWGAPGSGPGQFAFVDGSALSTDSVGNVYAADTLNHRVQVFRPDGVFLGAFGSAGGGAGQFSQPRSLDIDRTTDQLYVADTLNDRIQKFDLAMDSDSDTVLDTADNCRYLANPGQADDGGIGTGSGADGVGNACQCGDLTENGEVDGADVSFYRQHFADPAGMPLSPAVQALCSVIGDPGTCTLADVVAIRRTLAAFAAPGIAPVCFF